MTLSRLFLVAATTTFIVIAALYTIAFNYQFGAPIPAGYYINNWRWLKVHIAQQAKGRRVLLVGDSNVLFGMDSAYAEKQLGRPVINMGFHGGQSLDWILDVALSQARSGDIVVLPLVFPYYQSDYRVPNDWMVDQVIAWDRPYFDGLSLPRKLRYVAAIPPKALYQNLRKKWQRKSIIKKKPYRRLLSATEALAYYKQVAHLQSVFSYDYENINLHGDIRNTCGVGVKVKGPNYGVAKNQKTVVNNATLLLLLDTIHTLNARGVKVFVTSSVQWDDADTRGPVYQAAINKVWGTLQREGVPLLGGPTDYFFPPKAFFDTDYHLNCEYTAARTEILIKALRPVL
jgi:hypothetical protein